MKTLEKHFVPLAICIMIMAFVTGCSGTVDTGNSTSTAATRLRLATGTEQSDSLDAVGEALKGKELSETNVIAALKNNGYTCYADLYNYRRIADGGAIPGGGVVITTMNVEKNVENDEYVAADYFIFSIISATDSGIVNYAESYNFLMDLLADGLKPYFTIDNLTTYLSATKYSAIPTNVENEWLIVIDMSFDIPASDITALEQTSME